MAFFMGSCLWWLECFLSERGLELISGQDGQFLLDAGHKFADILAVGRVVLGLPIATLLHLNINMHKRSLILLLLF